MGPLVSKLGAVDLNLLAVFDAVMQERNVTRAGRRLGLSQPAISHALTRLRHMLKDDLFIRSPKGMVPTPRAEQMAFPVRAALDGLQQSLEPARFDPATADRHFRIAVDNYAAIVLVGPLTERIAKAAPGVTLDFRPSGTLNIEGLIERGELDIAIGPYDDVPKRFSRRPLLRDEFVVVSRRTHPMAARDLSIETFAALPHLEISSARHPTDFVDGALARRKLKRRVALRAPFLSAVRILIASDMISVLPRRIAEGLASYRPLMLRPLPIASPPIETAMISSRRLDNQPAPLWLRDVVVQVAGSL